MSEEYDVIVIGSGPGGYVAAIRCGQLGLKTACVEKSPYLGGTCLNVGCIPSKTLLHSSELYYTLSHQAGNLGIDVQAAHPNFPRMMKRKEDVVAGFRQGISALFKKNKVTPITGTASFLSPHSLKVSDGSSSQELSARYIIIATGSEPTPLPFLPFDEKRVISSTGALALKEIPKKMVVVGAGIIGVELGSVYSRIGTEVTFVEFMDRICPTLDETLSKQLLKTLTEQGMHFYLSSRVTKAEVKGNGVVVQAETADKQTLSLEADVALVSIGRRAYTQALGLEKAGLAATPRGLLSIDSQFRTAVPHIFAIGDVVDGPMLAHKASEEGVAAAEIIAGKHPSIDYMAIPNVVYTHPEVSSVGMTEAEAKQAGLNFKIGTFPFKANSRAKCTGEDEGFVKIMVDEKSDKIIGVHIIGSHASELIAAAALAIEKRTTGTQLANTPHAHPTLSEALKEAAMDIYKRAIHK